MKKCILCDEGITNPICPECIGRQMRIWFMEKNPEMIRPMLGYLEAARVYDEENTRCIICNKNMSICSHCFTQEILDQIDNSIKEEFLMSFNYF